VSVWNRFPVTCSVVLLLNRSITVEQDYYCWTGVLLLNSVTVKIPTMMTENAHVQACNAFNTVLIHQVPRYTCLYPVPMTSEKLVSPPCQREGTVPSCQESALPSWQVGTATTLLARRHCCVPLTHSTFPSYWQSAALCQSPYHQLGQPSRVVGVNVLLPLFMVFKYA
jgi:hypothetical protein